MFTGLVEGKARVLAAAAARGGLRLELDLGPVAEGVRPGDSICVAGCCLTVMALEGARAAFELSPETLAKTHLGAALAGARLNVERSLRLGDRLGGHFLTGHVDALGRVLRIEAEGDFARHTYHAPPALEPLLVPKGSVGVEGVSLTVAELHRDGQFAVALIPETLQRTTLGELRVGDALHLEGDLLGKYVLRQLGVRSNLETI